MELGPWLETEPGRKGVIDVENWSEITAIGGPPISRINNQAGNYT